VFLSFVVARGVPDFGEPGPGGAMVGFALWWMHMIESCADRDLAGADAAHGAFSSLAGTCGLCVVLMIGLTVVSQHIASPRCGAADADGSIQAFQATAADSPLLAEFSDCIDTGCQSGRQDSFPAIPNPVQSAELR